MSQIVGIIAFVACIAVLVLLPGREWPRAPGWMRMTAVVAALGMFGVGAFIFLAGAGGRDSPGGLVVVGFALGLGAAGLALLGWAWVGRLRPRSILARLFAQAPATPRKRTR